MQLQAPEVAPSPGLLAVRQLETLVTRVRKSGMKSLSEDELLDLGRVYRRAGAMLARARTAGLRGGDVESLNRLMAAAYPLVHPPTERHGSVWEFLLYEFPRTFRREFKVIMLATLVFFLGALGGAIAVSCNADAAEIALGSGWHDTLERVAERHENNQDWLPELQRPLASAGIMTNNIRVAMLAFASGILLCLGSFYLLAYNGLLIGAIAVVVHQHNVDAAFWGFVAPHGVVEIPAILVSAAAGLIIGHAFISPGRQYRGVAVRQAARRAVPLLIGVVIMLIEAGIVEGFLSPRIDLEPPVKFAIALFIFTLLVTWLIIGGRHAEKSVPVD